MERVLLEPSKRPLNVLMRNINNYVQIRLKNDIEYRGRMVQCDNYMNIILDGAAEYHGDEPVANYGNIFIRGNNILYIAVNFVRK